MAGTPEFLATGIPALVVAIVMYILFCVCRRKYTDIYEPRTRKVMPEVERAPASLPTSFMGWLPALISMKLEDLAQCSGVDAAARVAFQGTMLLAFLVLAFATCCALLPLYANSNGKMEDFDRLTLANVGTTRLEAEKRKQHFVVAVMCWACSLCVYGVLYLGMKAIEKLHLSERARLCVFWRQTVKVVKIPEGSRSADAIKSYYEAVAPGAVLYVQPIKDMGKQHEKLLPNYTKSWRALRHAEAVVAEKPEKRPMVKTGFAGLMGPKKDAIEHHTGKVEEYKSGLTSGIDGYEAKDGWSAAFVTFSGPKAAEDAVLKSKESKGGKEWQAALAPHPRDIFWPNMCKGRPDQQHYVRCIVAGLIVAFVVIIFAPLLAFTLSVTNLEKLAREYSWLSWINDIDASVKGLLQGLLPVVIVIVFNALVVPIMEALAKLSGVETYFDLNRRVMWYFLSHLVFNGFIIIAAAGSLFSALKEIIEDPSSIGDMLGKELPTASTFFILYVMAVALGGAPGKIALVAKVVVSRIKLKYLAKTDFEKEEAVEPSFAEFKPGVNYAGDIFVCVICLCYSFIAPLASVFGLLYFVLNTVTTKYLVTFYWKTTFNSGGKLSISAFRGVLLAFALGQAVVLLVIGLQGSAAASGAMVPLPIFSFLYGVTVDCWGPGRVIQWKVAESALAEGEDGTAKAKLMEPNVRSAWRQPSVCPNFEDPVHDRFNWGPAEASKAQGFC